MSKRLGYDFFCKLLDKFSKKGNLPNGDMISKRNVIKYFSGTKYKFHSSKTGIIIAVATLESWYRLWYNDINPINRFRPRREKDGMKDFVGINIIDAPDVDLAAAVELNIPDGLSYYRQPYVIPNGRKVGVLADIHIPYHSTPILKLAINYLRNAKIDVLVLNGDIFDFYAASKYLKVPSRPSIKAEMALGLQFLEQLRILFPTQKIIFKIGNHEDRLGHYLLRNAPDLYELESISLPVLLEFDRLGIDMVESSRYIKAGNLSIFHGHEIKVSGINIARSFRLKTGGHAMFAHNHKTSVDTFKTVDGNFEYCYSIGCLCDLWPDYAIFNQMNNGFATIDLFKDGNYHVDNLRIVNNLIVH